MYIGESWEIVDCLEAQSLARDGAVRRRTLHELWTQDRQEISGDVPDTPRVLLLANPCAGKTFLAVHPPPKSTLVCAAALLGNSLKLWWETGDTAGLVHRIPVKSGDAIFLPSGRLHTMGDGILIAEIQQNNDTIYRVFDWNRHERASLLAG